MAEQIKISGTFLDTFSEMATDIFFSWIFVRFGLHLGMLFGVKVGKMDTKKHSKRIPANKSSDKKKGHAGHPPVVL